MLSWFLRRLMSAFLLVVVLVSAVFFIVRAAPGDPLDQVTAADLGRQDRQLIRERWGLDASPGEQYLRWLGGLARGDLGTSLHQQRPVAEIVGQALPATLLLTGTAYALHLLLAVAAALVMATRRGTRVDRLVDGVGLTFYSLPGFWFGLMLILVFSRQLGWFPSGGLASPDADFMSAPRRLLDVAWHLALPATCLALGSFMSTARHLRASLIEVLDQDYVLAARSRGLPAHVVLTRHVLRNALLPVITLVGLSLPFLLGGAVVAETIFSWPGLGRVTIAAIFTRDYPVIMATTAVTGVTVVAGSLLADLLYMWADPRVRLERGAGRR